jgi:Asp/Glu/hydantoin racemase
LGLSPVQIKTDPSLLEKMLQVASYEIENNAVDTFVLGCGCFVGRSNELQQQLRLKYNKSITVVDLVGITFAVAAAL